MVDADFHKQMEISHPANWCPTTNETSEYIEAYFEHYHPQYPLIHEPSFRAQWMEIIPQPPPQE